MIECERSKLPSVIQNEITYFIQIDEPQAPQTVALSKLLWEAGKNYNWSVKDNKCYLCRVKNYRDKPVFHVAMTFKVEFSEAVKHSSGIRSGNIKHKAEYPIVIPDIPAEKSFEFYIYNLSTLYPRIIVPNTATLEQLGDNRSHTVKMRISFNAAFFLAPHVWT